MPEPAAHAIKISMSPFKERPYRLVMFVFAPDRLSFDETSREVYRRLIGFRIALADMLVFMLALVLAAKCLYQQKHSESVK